MSSPLRIAIYNGNYEAAELLLYYGADIEHRLKGNTILHSVIGEYGGPHMMEFLIRHGADVSAINDKGQSILVLAIHRITLRSSPNGAIFQALMRTGKEASIYEQ